MIKIKKRGVWASKAGFVLAAAGSAVGLGNLWRFPYITGENGGGIFVILYLICIAFVGFPIMIAEVMIGRRSQKSVVGSFLSLGNKAWSSVGWLGVISAYIILSFYSVIAGWALHYTVKSASGFFGGRSVDEVMQLFGEVSGNPTLNVTWHGVFMVLTILVVIGGVQRGIERWSRILMPLLLLMLVGLMIKAMTLPGFGEAFSFVFGFNTDKLTTGGVLEALGHSFFTLSLGMGAMLTYGSYLSKKADIVSSAVAVTILDTVIALLACLVLFPITFTFGMQPGQGPGLIFQNIPVAFAQLPGGGFLGTLFFALVVFAALTSSMSLLEVATSYFIDQKGWSRKAATVLAGSIIFLIGIPSALSNSTFSEEIFFQRNWFDFLADMSSNFFLPLGGLGIALFVAWKLDEELKREEFFGSSLQKIFGAWHFALRYIVPVAISAVFLHAVGVI